MSEETNALAAAAGIALESGSASSSASASASADDVAPPINHAAPPTDDVAAVARLLTASDTHTALGLARNDDDADADADADEADASYEAPEPRASRVVRFICWMFDFLI